MDWLLRSATWVFATIGCISGFAAHIAFSSLPAARRLERRPSPQHFSRGAIIARAVARPCDVPPKPRLAAQSGAQAFLGFAAAAGIAVASAAAAAQSGRKRRLRRCVLHQAWTVRALPILRSVPAEVGEDVHMSSGEQDLHRPDELPTSTPPADQKSSFAAERKQEENRLGPLSIAMKIKAVGQEAIRQAFVKKDDEPQWKYRKGIEGAGMGPILSELIWIPTDPEVLLSFVNDNILKVSLVIRDNSKRLGFEALWLMMINMGQTLGIPGNWVDGIPVQNKWMHFARERVQALWKDDSKVLKAEVVSFMSDVVTGRTEQLLGVPLPMFLEDYGEGLGVWKITIGPKSSVVVSDPLIAKHILYDQPDNYDSGVLHVLLEHVVGKGFIPADPFAWKLRRRALVPGFQTEWLKGTTSLMNDCAVRLMADLEHSILETGTPTINMEEKFNSVAMDIMGKAIFGYDFAAVERASPMLVALKAVMREAERRVQSIFPYWSIPGGAQFFNDQKDYEKNLLLINSVLNELIRNAAEDGESESPEMSLMQYLLATSGADTTAKQLHDDLLTVLIAGHETSAALLTWTLHELTKPEHDDKLQKLLEEIDRTLGDRDFSFEDMQRLPFLRMCLLEALRLYPQSPLLIRRCANADEVQVGPICSVKGTINFLPGQEIVISAWSLQRSTKLWGEDAHEFNPHRWERRINPVGRWEGYDPELVSTYPNEMATNFAFLPFGGGPRKCVGESFALLEAEVILVNILRRFDFEANGQVNLAAGATIRTKTGLFMNVSMKQGTVARPTKPPEPAESVPKAPSQEKVQGPRMEANMSLPVAGRVEPENLIVPTGAELRQLFAEQASRSYSKQSEENPQEVEDAYLVCKEITSEFSKTFFLGSQLLDTAEQRAVWAIYHWCRAVDELVDGPAAATATIEDLELCEEQLQLIFGMNEKYVPGLERWEVISLRDSIQRFSLIERPFQDMIGGMAMDLLQTRYETFQELEVYCYRVAGTVGVMTLPVLGFDPLQNFTDAQQERTITAALSLGLAFQLTNILRDVGEDARRDRIYLPLQDLRRFGIAEEELIEAARTPGSLHKEARWQDFMDFQFERCEKYFREAEEGFVGIAATNRFGVLAAVYVYGEILAAIRLNNYDNLRRRAFVPLIDKVRLLAKAFWRMQELQNEADANVRNGKILWTPLRQAV